MNKTRLNLVLIEFVFWGRVEIKNKNIVIEIRKILLNPKFKKETKLWSWDEVSF